MEFDTKIPNRKYEKFWKIEKTNIINSDLQK